MWSCVRVGKETYNRYPQKFEATVSTQQCFLLQTSGQINDKKYLILFKRLGTIRLKKI